MECATLLVIPQMKIDEAGVIFENEAMNSANEKLLRYGAKCKVPFLNLKSLIIISRPFLQSGTMQIT